MSKFAEFPKENYNPLAAGNTLLIYYIACNESLGSVAPGKVERRVLVVPVLNPTPSLQGCVIDARIHTFPGSALDKLDLKSKSSFRMNNERINTST